MRRWSVRVLLVIVVALSATACRSSETSLTGPSGSKCTIALSFTGGVLSAAGGAASVGVTTGRECTWSAASSAAWLTVGTSNGQGNGTVPLTFAANASTSSRQGTLTIGGQSLVLTQAGAACQFTLNPQSVSVPSAATTVPVTVSAQPGCAWTAVSAVSWLSLTGNASGSGNGQVVVAVEANPGTLRSGTVAIASQTLTVTQASAPLGCSYSLTPSALSVSAAGGTGSFSVGTAAGCSWTAATSVPWIAVTGGSSGSGSGTVSFAFAANAGVARSGAILVGGESFTLSQQSGAPACTYAVSPSSRAFDQSGGPGSVSVSAPAGCEWTASSGAPWVRITSGASGEGNGSVGYNVELNPGGARSATLVVAGQTVQVTQGGCSYGIAPASASIGAGGGPGSVAVSAQAGCGWTATSGDAWLTITSGASGSGPGTVSYSAATNAGAARTGVLTIAGQRFELNQSAAVVTCTYTVTPLAAALGPGSGAGSVEVTTSGSCAWTAAVASGTWVRVTAGASGTGSGRVEYAFDANPAAATRAATLSVAGQTVTLTQAAAPCTYAVSPGSFSFPASGGTGSITVTSPTGCSWVAQSGAAWITITGGATGSGSGTVAFTVAANLTGAQRQATITVQDQPVTVTQVP